jgi:hypothetical protein
VTNPRDDQVRLVAVQAPHSRFRSEPIDLDLTFRQSVDVEQTFRVEAAPGEEIENAFVIFVVETEEERWRVLFRVRVRIEDGGSPSVSVEAMSTHRVGFSEA